MDKKDFKYFIKKVTKIWLLLEIPLLIIFYFINLFFNDTLRIGQNVILEVVLNILSMIFMTFLLLVITYIIIGLIFIFIRIKRKNNTIVADSYIRELPEYFPPAIASFLLDLSVEITTDYTATIAYLMSKKYIKLDEKGVKILNKDISGLSRHEEYVFNCLTKKQKLNNEEFIKLIMDDALSMGLIKRGRRKIHFLRNLFITLFLFSFSVIMLDYFNTGILYVIFSLVQIISEILVFVVLGFSVYLLIKYEYENYYRTQIGKIESLKWASVKRYFRDFTLMSEKKLNDITLFDDYIPYAIALNEAKSIEKYILNNKDYRNLIYGRIDNINDK